LTINLDSGTTRRMGRPPLSKKSDTKPVLVRLTEDIAHRIDVLAGPNKRAEFIREAVEKELRRRERE
jgi:predicted DNA-binding protein